MKSYVVDLGLLRENARVLMEKAGGAAVYGVVKGNGYGLGLLPMAEALWESGVRRFAVAEPWEARDLREKYPEAEILMLRETRLEDELGELMAAGAVLTVGSRETAEKIAGMAPEPWPVHVKIDTGMGRYGFLPEDLDGAAAVYGMEGLRVRGIYTHFHSAFSEDGSANAQFAAFLQVLEGLKARGIEPGVRHCCNSSAFLKYPDMRLDAVRLGSAVLGRLSFSGDYGLTPVGWCEAQIEMIREIPAGHSVGYGASWTARRPTRIAVVGVGTYHGFDAPARGYPATVKECAIAVLGSVKALIKKRTVCGELGGGQAPVIGFIGMVQTILDVTDVPCAVGDTVTLPIRPLAVKGLPITYRG